MDYNATCNKSFAIRRSSSFGIKFKGNKNMIFFFLIKDRIIKYFLIVSYVFKD